MLIPTAVAILGLILYFAIPSIMELGRILFFVGTFWLVSIFAHGRINVPELLPEVNERNGIMIYLLIGLGIGICAVLIWRKRVTK